MSPAWFDHQKRGQASVSVRISDSVRTIHHLHCLTWERRRGEQGGSVWENRDDARSAGCNQGEMLHVAVVTQACIHVAVVIHTCLLLPPAMTLRDRKVRVSKTITGSGVGVRIIMVLAYVSLCSKTSHTHLWDHRLAD